MTKFETALQVSVLIWVLVLWDGAVKRLLVKSKETVGNSGTVLKVILGHKYHHNH